MHDSIFYLINAYELDSDYNHSPLFNNSATQFNWFAQRIIKTLDHSMYHRKNDELNVVIYEPIENLKLVNYLIVVNPADNTMYYYFVVDKEYNDANTSTLQLQLDLVQTYMFDLNFRECLVEREHDYKWNYNSVIGNVAPSNVDENLDVGEYELKNIYNIYNYNNKGTYIIASGEMLGESDDPRPGGDTPSPTPSSENYKNKLLDENGVVLLKHFEGFRAEAYQDQYGYWTIGYGVTQANYPNEYASLQPVCTEQQASEVMGDIVTPNFATGVYNRVVAEFGLEWLNQHRFNALVSYVWQWGNLDSGGLWNVLVANKDDNEALYQGYYNLGTIQGYEHRRRKEASVFAYGEYGDMPIGTGTGTLTDNNGKGYIPSQFK